MFSVTSVTFGVERELYIKGVVTTVTSGVQTLGLKMDEKHNQDVMETRCWQDIYGMTMRHTWKNDDVRRKVGVRE